MMWFFGKGAKKGSRRKASTKRRKPTRYSSRRAKKATSRWAKPRRTTEARDARRPSWYGQPGWEARAEYLEYLQDTGQHRRQAALERKWNKQGRSGGGQ